MVGMWIVKELVERVSEFVTKSGGGRDMSSKS